FHYETHDQLRTHLADFMAAYNFARRLKTLGGLTPYEYICKIWTSEPDRFILNPIHQMPGLNTYGSIAYFREDHFSGGRPQTIPYCQHVTGHIYEILMPIQSWRSTGWIAFEHSDRNVKRQRPSE